MVQGKWRWQIRELLPVAESETLCWRTERKYVIYILHVYVREHDNPVERKLPCKLSAAVRYIFILDWYGHVREVGF